MFDETVKVYPIERVKESSSEFDEVSELSDESLVKKVLAGDETAFAEIFNRYRKLAVHLVSRFFRQREEIEDIVQQVFTKIYCSLKDFRGGHANSFSSWISRLTVNVCYDELRKRQKRAENLFSDFTEEEEKQLEGILEDKTANFEKTIVEKDLAEKVLSRLNVQERMVMTLHYGENLSVSEVAKAVGWSESNVKIRLFRCRNSLRGIFGKLFS